MTFVHSTEYAAVKLMDHNSKVMESLETPVAVFIDISKAFVHMNCNSIYVDLI